MSDDNAKKWWEKFFGEDFSAFLLDRDNDPGLSPTADFLIAALDLKPGDTVYDQCCGTGAVSRALAEKGINVIGVDQADVYIRHATDLADKNDLPAAFETGDAFTYVTDGPVDAAFNWYTSFGYTPDDEKNIRMLERVFESLKPGGRFALDYMNVPNLIANLKPVFTRQARIDGEDVSVEKHTTIDQDRGMVASRWVYNFPDGHTKEASGESRLYMPEDLKALFEKAGFEDVTLQGGMNGEPCTDQYQRCIVMGVKPG